MSRPPQTSRRSTCGNHFILARRDCRKSATAEAGAASSTMRVFATAESLHKDPQLSTAACARNTRRIRRCFMGAPEGDLRIRRKGYHLDSLPPKNTGSPAAPGRHVDATISGRENSRCRGGRTVSMKYSFLVETYETERIKSSQRVGVNSVTRICPCVASGGPARTQRT